MHENEISKIIIGKAIAVHRCLGPGLLESAYRACLAYELRQLDRFKVEEEKPLPVIYKDIKLNCGYRLDMVINRKVIVELKTVENLLPIHEAQLLTYLKLTDTKLGLLLNFNVCVLKDGIKRIVNYL